MEVLLQEWQEIGVAPFPPRSRFNGQGSKALQEYEKCIKRGVEPGSSAPPVGRNPGNLGIQKSRDFTPISGIGFGYLG